MRIVSGTHRGRRLNPPNNLPVRPTTDIAKESLFNILNNYIDFEEVRVLDIFAGTGSISFEFASRGSTDITSVDSNFRCIDFIERTAVQFKMAQITAVRSDVFSFLKYSKNPYDIIFADPPFDMPDREKIVELIFNNNLLKPDGYFIIEHSRDIDFSKHPNFSEMRKYGKVQFSFFVAANPVQA
ncbi:MAG: 16S rRNA (guanine(966)-N(2))-methyltransferase RsmD [Bacteroidota bacterium]